MTKIALGLVFLLLLDQGVKHYLRLYFPSLVEYNSALAFSQGSAFLIPLGLVLLLLLFLYFRGEPRTVWLLLALAIGSNVIDRLLVGSVIDYLPFGPVKFNLADLLILATVVWLGYHFLTKKGA